ncbi:MAG: hypothetical protein K2Z76_26010, partial [Mycobacterium gordonae]|nr:hypothetical protein [Mycobacterium gordonae]
MKTSLRLAATTFALTAGLGMYGLGLATGAQAQPGPLPQWCPGDFWDPVWGNNWDNVNCHDNWRGAGPNPHPGPGGPGLGAPGNPG